MAFVRPRAESRDWLCNEKQLTALMDPNKPLRPSYLFEITPDGWVGDGNRTPAELKIKNLIRARVTPNAPTEHICAVIVPLTYPRFSKRPRGPPLLFGPLIQKLFPSRERGRQLWRSRPLAQGPVLRCRQPGSSGGAESRLGNMTEHKSRITDHLRMSRGPGSRDVEILGRCARRGTRESRKLVRYGVGGARKPWLRVFCASNLNRISVVKHAYFRWVSSS